MECREMSKGGLTQICRVKTKGFQGVETASTLASACREAEHLWLELFIWHQSGLVADDERVVDNLKLDPLPTLRVSTDWSKSCAMSTDSIRNASFLACAICLYEVNRLSVGSSPLPTWSSEKTQFCGHSQRSSVIELHAR